MDNPFSPPSRSNGGTGKICPILGMVTIPRLTKPVSEVRDGKDDPLKFLDLVEVSANFFSCRGSECYFWDSEKNDCVIKLSSLAQIESAEALKELIKSLGPLTGIFGKKK